MDRILGLLNSTEVIRKKLPVIIESFVSVYGEEYRDIITKRIMAADIFGYFSIDSLKDLIKIEQKELSKPIISKVLDSYGFSDSNKEIVKFVGDNLSNYSNSYLNLTASAINRLKEYGISESTLNIIVQNVNPVDPTVTKENVEELFKTGKLDYIVNMNNSFLSIMEEYKKYENSALGPYIELRDKMSTYSEKLDEKYMLEVLKKYDKYLNDVDREKLDEMYKKGEYSPYNLKGYNVLGELKDYNISYLSAFSKESNEKLQSPDTYDFIKIDILEHRIKYFKYRGIDLGDEYEAYENDPRCKELWITDADEILDFKNEKLLEIDRNIYSSMKSCIEAEKVAKEKNLLDKEDILSPDILRSGATCVMPNLYEKDGEYVLSPMVVINSKNNDHIDQFVMHELNHVIELSKIEVKGNTYSALCGWDPCTGNINQDSSIPTFLDSPKREYELFNEIINELLSQRVTMYMHEQGEYLLSDAEHAKVTGGTSYERNLKFVGEFLNEFLPEIISSRINGDMQIIFDKVGKENFDNLNSIINTFSNKFPGMTYFNVMQNYMNGIEDEDVKTVKMLVEKSREIVSSMKEYGLNASSQTL